MCRNSTFIIDGSKKHLQRNLQRKKGFNENYSFEDIEIDDFNEEALYSLEQLIIDEFGGWMKEYNYIK